MKMRIVLAASIALAILAAAGCASSGSASEREWAKAECRNILDSDARTKCLERVDKEYGTRGS